MKNWSSSGLSAAAYCREHGIDYATFINWRKEIQRRDTANRLAAAERREPKRKKRRGRPRKKVPREATATDFVAVNVKDERGQTGADSLDIILRGGAIIRLHVGQLHLLPSVIASLESC